MNISFLAVSYKRYWLACLCLCAAASAAYADEGLIPRDQHPWARFRPGSWKLVKVTTETFDKEGKSLGESVSETRTMLVSVDADSYELQVGVLLDIVGKQFPSPPRITRHGVQGEGVGQQATIRRQGQAALKIGDRTLTAQTAEIETSDKESRRITRLQYEAGVVPYVLTRRSLTFDAEGKVLQETNVQTLDLQSPHMVLGMRRSTWKTRTIQEYPGGKVITDEIHCLDVPGGVVEHTSEERDDKGVVRRRSKLELVNYGIAAADKPLRRRHNPPRRSKR